jgi:hypothetical protein
VRIENLESENFIMQGEADPETLRRYREVMKEKSEMERLVNEMTEFLADYGLKWLGNEGTEEEGEE